MIKVASIIVRKAKGYVPTEAVMEGGPYVLVRPIYTVNLDASDIVQALKRVAAAGHPKFPSLTRKEWKNREDPILKVAGVRTWKELAKDGASYTIERSRDSITLYVSRLDQKGRFEADPAKTTMFPSDTPLAVIVAAILHDVQSRPQLLDSDRQ